MVSDIGKGLIIYVIEWALSKFRSVEDVYTFHNVVSASIGFVYNILWLRNTITISQALL